MNIVFAGTPEFALPSLQALLASRHHVLAVYTQADRPKGRGRRLFMSPIKHLALEKNIPVYQPLTLRNVDEQKKLATWQPDLLIVVAYGLILTRPVLDIPAFGCINVHASLLPRWRGAAPIQRALLAGDDETGISIMQMNEGVDTGPILQSVVCRIEQSDTCQTLQHRLARLGAEALLTSLNALQQGHYHLQTQSTAGTYAKKIDKTEAEIHWQCSAETIERMIRAFNPKPMAYTFLGPLLLRIWAAQILEKAASTITAAPGIILSAKPEGMDIMTGKGIVRLLQLQLPGGRCLPVSELLHSKSHLFRPGEYLGRRYA